MCSSVQVEAVPPDKHGADPVHDFSPWCLPGAPSVSLAQEQPVTDPCSNMLAHVCVGAHDTRTMTHTDMLQVQYKGDHFPLDIGMRIKLQVPVDYRVRLNIFRSCERSLKLS